MKINLLNIKIHNFLAFGDAELTLNNQGYCLLTGVNKDPRDNATSNGSGKSTLISAICWTLTGETVQEVKTNVANIYLNSGCWVELTFDVDEHHYVITRYRDDPKYKTNLNIIVDGNDVSGKTLSDSEEQLSKYLPDLTSELISSVIILGQGLPHKFSNYKPAGRKNLLEKLSKSDFMIEDIKGRIENRSATLATDQRTLEDNKLSAETSLNVYNNQLEAEKAHLVEISAPKDFDSEIKNLQDQIQNDENTKDSAVKTLQQIDESYNTLNTQKTRLLEDKSTRLKIINETYNKDYNNANSEKYDLQSKMNALKAEVAKLKSVTDVCPTCGQKIPGAIKPDTSVQEAEIERLAGLIQTGDNKLSQIQTNYSSKSETIEKAFEKDLFRVNNEMSQLNTQKTTADMNKQRAERNLLNLNNNLTRVKMEKDSYYKNIEECKKKIEALEKQIKETTGAIEKLVKDLKNIDEHISIINKLKTLAQRDFRGYLLSNIITFIDAKAKEYASIVFGTNQLDFTLNGNNIDITYCNKDYELLSGGEKQKCDLCLQFALRDMMSQYLGFSSNILCLDEIFDNLDSISCDNVINMISTKLNDLDTIFIISHRSGTLGIPIDNEIIIEKNEQGISSIR